MDLYCDCHPRSRSAGGIYQASHRAVESLVKCELVEGGGQVFVGGRLRLLGLTLDILRSQAYT